MVNNAEGRTYATCTRAYVLIRVRALVNSDGMGAVGLGHPGSKANYDTGDEQQFVAPIDEIVHAVRIYDQESRFDEPRKS